MANNVVKKKIRSANISNIDLQKRIIKNISTICPNLQLYKPPKPKKKSKKKNG